MNTRGIHIGLDIGTSKICAIAGEIQPEGPIKIIGIGDVPCDGLHHGTIVDIEATAEAINKAIEEVEKTAAVRVDEVTAGIAGDHIVSLNCQGVIGISGSSKKRDEVGQEITAEDVERVLESAKAVGLPNGRQIIHVIPQQFLVDDQKGVRNPVGMIGRRLEAQVHLVTSAISNTKNIMSAVKRADCKVRALVLEPLAAAHSAIGDDERGIGVCLVDIGAGTTDVIALSDYGVQHSRSLPVGSMHVSSDIAKILRITESQGESLKINYGSCYTPDTRSDRVFEVKGIAERADRNLNEAELAMYIEARMEEILRLIHKDLHTQGVYQHLNSGLVFTGGGSQIRGLLPLARKIFDLPVRLAKPRGFEDETGNSDRPEYTVATGLVRYAAKYSESSAMLLDSSTVSGWLSKIGAFLKENF